MRNRAAIKEEAKQIVRRAQASPILVTAIVLAISFVLDRMVNLVRTGSFVPPLIPADVIYDSIMTGNYYALMQTANITSAGTFFSVLVSLFAVVLSAGYSVYCMGIRQGLAMPCSTLLEGLSVAGKLIWCYILMQIKVFLWSLLFFFPGVVAAYRYRFAYFNLLTDPSLSVGDAIQLSCQQTQGVKGELFLLDLSFLGWELLSVFTLGLLDLWLLPYRTVSNLAYFEDAQYRLGRAPYGGGATPPSNPPWEF